MVPHRDTEGTFVDVDCHIVFHTESLKLFQHSYITGVKFFLLGGFNMSQMLIYVKHAKHMMLVTWGMKVCPGRLLSSSPVSL